MKRFEQFHTSTFIKKFNKIDATSTNQYTVLYKGYPRLPAIKLPAAIPITISFQDILLNRKSSREFSTDKKINISELSSLLRYSVGLKNIKNENENRFYPSAGARYPIETYLFARNIQGIGPALYHYYVRTHCLEKLDEYKQTLITDCFSQVWIKKTDGLIVLTALFDRNVMKYGERGYRHVLSETGHMAQNIYLVSSALKLKCCAIGGYVDPKLNTLIDIDGITETVVYVLAIGK